MTAERISLSPLQYWILSFLAIRNLHGSERPRLLGLDWVPVSTFIKIAPPSLLNEVNYPEDFIKLIMPMVKNQLIQFDGTNVGVTQNGILQFRKNLSPLATTVKSREFNKIIDKIKENPELKNELKQLGKKFKDRAEDEIIDAIIQVVVRMSFPAGILYLMHMLNIIKM